MPRFLPEITPRNTITMGAVALGMVVAVGGIVHASTFVDLVRVDVDGVVTNVRTESETVSELLADESLEAPIEIAAQMMLHKDLWAALGDLPERERTILQLRYGLLDGQRRTLEEVGVAFGITRERTRQLEAEALRRLRHRSVGARLQGYLD